MVQSLNTDNSINNPFQTSSNQYPTDHIQAMADLSNLDKVLDALVQAIASGDDLVINMIKDKLKTMIANLQSLFSNSKDFTPTELSMLKLNVAQVNDLLMIPDQALTSNVPFYAEEIGDVKGGCDASFYYLKANP